MTLIECEVTSSPGATVWLPYETAMRLAALGSVRLPKPKPDERYRKPGALPLASTWQDGRFWPMNYTTR